MLGLTKKVDYALLALSYLTQEERISAVRSKEIAERFAIPVELLAKILQRLAKAGLVVSTPGPTGGYHLARSAEDITIGAVIEAVEGLPALVQCMKADHNVCVQHSSCTIRKPLELINTRVFEMLSMISLNEISGLNGALASRDTRSLTGSQGFVPLSSLH